MTQPTAFTVAMLAWGISAFPKAYTSSKQANAALTQVQVGISFLQKTIISYKAGSTDYYLAYQVCMPQQKPPAAAPNLVPRKRKPMKPAASSLRSPCVFLCAHGLAAGCAALLPLPQQCSELCLVRCRQVGNISMESRYWGYPENYTLPRPSFYVPTTFGVADLAGIRPCRNRRTLKYSTLSVSMHRFPVQLIARLPDLRAQSITSLSPELPVLLAQGR